MIEKKQRQNLKSLSIILCTALYPLLVYITIKYGFTLILLAFLSLIFVKNFGYCITQQKKKQSAYWLAGLLLVILGAYLSETITIKFLPVLVQLCVGLFFAYTLWHKPSLIERFAQTHYDVVPKELVSHCHRVTQIWVLFFVLQILIGIYIIFWASSGFWAIYYGFIIYLQLFLLIIGEYIYRRIRYKHLSLPGFIENIKIIVKNAHLATRP